MSDSKATRIKQWVELPTAPQAIVINGTTYNAGGGWIGVLVASTAQSLDLTTIDWTGPIQDAPTQAGHGATDTYVTILVVGVVPVYIVGYPSIAAYNAQNPTIAGATGANPAGFSWPIAPWPTTGPGPTEDSGRFVVRKGFNHILGMISSGTPTVYIRRSGPYEGAR